MGGQSTLTGTVAGDNNQTVNWTLTVGGKTYTGTGLTASATWDGKDTNNMITTPGNYTATLTAQTIPNCSATQATTTVEVTAQTTPAVQQSDSCEEQTDMNVNWSSTANVGSGNLSHSQTLFTVPNSILMSGFNLVYNSLDNRTAPLGAGWTHTYNITLSQNNNGSYKVVEGDGTKTVYYANNGHYMPRNSAYPILTVNGNTYTLEHKNGITYTFNSSGNIISIADRNSNSITLTYTSGLLSLITDSSGRTVSLFYNGNILSSVIDTSGNIHAFTYAGNNLTGISSSVVDLGTQTWAYTYYSSGLMHTKQDPGGYATTYTYDANNRVNGATDPNNKTRSMVYNQSSQQAQLTEKDGGLWTFYFDPTIGALTQKKDPLGYSTYYGFDSNRNLNQITDQRGNVTTRVYDSASNILSVTDALLHTTYYTYNALNLVLTITNALGYVTTMTYDLAGNLLTVTTPPNRPGDPQNTTTYEYDSRGNTTKITDGLGNITRRTYDSSNYLRTITEPTGAVTYLDYDSAGRLVQIKDALNHITILTYNGLNQVTSILDPENHLTVYHYDLKGNVDYVTDANGNTTHFTHTYDDQIASIRDANNHTTTIVHGGTGCPACGGGVDKPTSITDANNNTTSFEYTLTGKPSKQTNPSGSFRTNTYDPANNLHTTTDENGATTIYTNDELNRVTNILFPDSTTKTFGFDAVGNLTSTSNQNIQYTLHYDANNNPLSVLDSLGRTVSYVHDVLNRRSQLTTPDSRTVNYGYDGGSRLTSIQAGADTFVPGYDLLNRRNTLSHPNGVSTSYAFSDAGNLTGINIVDSQLNVINSFTHTFDGVGNKNTLTDLLGIHSFYYDYTYQLTQATHPLPQPIENHAYDYVGNQIGNVVDADNKLLEDSLYIYTYDANGNRISRTEKATNIVTIYGYDYENRLIGVSYPGMVIQYKYDSFDRRIEKNVNGTITRFTYDGPNIVTEYDGTGNVTAGYVHNLAIDDPLSVTQSGLTYYYHKDSLGTTGDLTDATGAVVQTYDCDSFGNIVGASGTITQPYIFTGREFDPETGLYYYRERPYDPVTGTFITRDPLGFEAKDVNVYRYVNNSPINLTDPFGLDYITPEEGVEIYNVAKSWAEIKVPYLFGGKTKKKADCSGSTWAIYKEAGHEYHYSDTASFPKNPLFKPSPNNVPQVGDVGWWKGHVVIYAGDGNVYTAHLTGGPPYSLENINIFRKKGPVKWYRYYWPD